RMPKKAKESSDKREQDKKMTKQDSASANKDVSGEKEKIYLAQIGFLSEKLERFEQKCDELETQKKDLNLKYSSLEMEKADIVDFLRRSLLDKEEEVERLSERLETVQEEAQREREETQLQHKLQKEQLQKRMDALTVENKTLLEKLTCVEQFLNERDQMTANLDALKKQLSRQEKEHRVDLHNRDIQALMDKNKWEKKLESHVADMESEVQSLVNQKLPQTTVLALEQNTELRERFLQLSQHAQELVQRNTALQKTKTELKLDVENLEQMFKEVSRNNCVQKRVVEQLTEKCTQLQTELKQYKHKCQQLHSLHSQTMDEMEMLRFSRSFMLKLHCVTFLVMGLPLACFHGDVKLPSVFTSDLA
uniref:Cilia- and flagella-associated protein 157 n=1 Tax=Periophthalmus magnuspinnatus TaxID=409849 RepID=A0A3B4AUE8_9GOBI